MYYFAAPMTLMTTKNEYKQKLQVERTQPEMTSSFLSNIVVILYIRHPVLYINSNKSHLSLSQNIRLVNTGNLARIGVLDLVPRVVLGSLDVTITLHAVLGQHGLDCAGAGGGVGVGACLIISTACWIC